MFLPFWQRVNGKTVQNSQKRWNLTWLAKKSSDRTYCKVLPWFSSQGSGIESIFKAMILLLYAKVIYALFIKRASLNKKGIDYLSLSLQRWRAPASSFTFVWLAAFSTKYFLFYKCIQLNDIHDLNRLRDKA